MTKEPEKTTTQSGISVCKMSVAVNRKVINSQGNRDCDFFNVVAWRGLADNCAEYLKKGNKISVVGRLETRSYEDKNGDKRTAIEIVAAEVEFLTPKGETKQDPEQKPKLSSELEKKGAVPVQSDDLPF